MLGNVVFAWAYGHLSETGYLLVRKEIGYWVDNVECLPQSPAGNKVSWGDPQTWKPSFISAFNSVRLVHLKEVLFLV